tara:strand:- start:594 stop:920 length:327 start_codon:yes stop_codon:yes gene_type:complete
MNKKTSDQDHLNILRLIDSEKKSNQREMADNLGISLGKLNFCLNELKKKGYVKFKNFKKNKNKLNYMYILTPVGISKKTKLLVNFMKRKMSEYDELKKDLERTKLEKK